MRKAVPLFLACLAASCSTIEQAALRKATALFERGRPVTLDEPDWQLAKDAAPSQLKLAETLLHSDPENLGLRRLAAEGFGGGAFLFWEDAEPARAKGLYLRGRDHALIALARKPAFKGLKDLPQDKFEAALAQATAEDLPDLFWAGFSWAGWVNLSKDDAAALAELPKAVALMRRVYDLDKTYHFAGADLFFGVYYASRPPILGGDPRKAKEHFDWAHRITKGDYLMNHVLNARWYAVAVQDRELFKQLLNKVLDAPAGKLPEAGLTDAAAKKKAAALLERIDDFF